MISSLERHSAEDHHPARRGIAVLHGDGRVPGRQVAQLGARQLLPAQLDRAGVHEHPVLERGVRGEVDAGPRVEHQLGAEQGGERRHRGGASGQRSQEHPQDASGQPDGLGDVMLEVARRMPVAVGQSHPQLHPVQHGGRRRGDLRVADAVPAGHEVDLAGPDERVLAQAVAVLDLAAEQPADGLQPGVWMGCDVHATAGPDVVGTVVVGEAPRADQRALPLRQGPAHGHRPGAAQGDRPRCQDLHDGPLRHRDVRAALAPLLDRVGLRVGHRRSFRGVAPTTVGPGVRSRPSPAETPEPLRPWVASTKAVRGLGSGACCPGRPSSPDVSTGPSSTRRSCADNPLGDPADPPGLGLPAARLRRRPDPAVPERST